MDNPYLRLLEEHFEHKTDTILSIDGFERTSGKYTRKRLIKKYAFAIPDKSIIETIVSHSPILEVGAGSGYWAKLIDESGGDIIAFDTMSRTYQKQWYPINETIADTSQYPDRTLFLCWPENNSPMGENAVKNYTGDCVLLIGERQGQCTGNDSMYYHLDNKYTLEDTQCLPNWYGLQDYLFIYKR